MWGGRSGETQGGGSHHFSRFGLITNCVPSISKKVSELSEGKEGLRKKGTSGMPSSDSVTQHDYEKRKSQTVNLTRSSRKNPGGKKWQRRWVQGKVKRLKG